MNDFIAQQGWQCPICKRVYSPHTPCCFYCGADGTTKTSTDGTVASEDFITEEDYTYNKKKHRWEISYVRDDSIKKTNTDIPRNVTNYGGKE